MSFPLDISKISPIKCENYSNSSSDEESSIKKLIKETFQEKSSQQNESLIRWSDEQHQKLINIRNELPDLDWNDTAKLVSEGDILRTGRDCSRHYKEHLRMEANKVTKVGTNNIAKLKKRSDRPDFSEKNRPVKKEKSSVKEEIDQAYNRGLELYDKQDYNQALEILLPLKKHSEAAYFAGMSYYELGLLNDALPLLKYSIKTSWSEQISKKTVEECQESAERAIQVCTWVGKIKIQEEEEPDFELDLENELFEKGCKSLETNYVMARTVFKKCKESGEKFFHIALSYPHNKTVASHYFKKSIITPWSKSIPITSIRDTVSDYLTIINQYWN